jgi:dipeptidase E
MAEAERWAADIAGPAYAIDDQTAIKVADGKAEVISEGQWRQFGSPTLIASPTEPSQTHDE